MLLVFLGHEFDIFYMNLIFTNAASVYDRYNTWSR